MNYKTICCAGFLGLSASSAFAVEAPMSCTIVEMCAAGECQETQFSFNIFPQGDNLAFGNQNGDAAVIQVHPDAPDGVLVLTLVEPGVDAFLLVIQAEGAFEVVGLQVLPSERGALVGKGQCVEDG